MPLSLSYAKLDHVPSTLPDASVSTPSKSLGGLTRPTVSMLVSRKRMVRESGNESGSMLATSVARECIWLSSPSPTTQIGSPGVSFSGFRVAAVTGVVPMSLGS